jgi:ribonuclease HI
MSLTLSRNVSAPLQGTPQTNQRAELTAALLALQLAPVSQPINILTDSNYTINCATTWCISWEKNNWTTSQGKPVMNKDLVVQIRAKLKEREANGASTEFTWIKGHANEAGNVAADELAVRGARRAQAELRAQAAQEKEN